MATSKRSRGSKEERHWEKVDWYQFKKKEKKKLAGCEQNKVAESGTACSLTSAEELGTEGY